MGCNSGMPIFQTSKGNGNLKNQVVEEIGGKITEGRKTMFGRVIGRLEKSRVQI